MRDTAITFNVDPAVAGEVTVDYLPYGTRVLKLKVVNTAGPTDVPLILQPRNDVPKQMSPGTYAVPVDDCDDISVAWGAGHESGPCAHGTDIGWKEVCSPLARDASSYSYLHVMHRPDASVADLPDTTLTLFATAGADARPFGTLKIHLRAPEAGVRQDPVRPVWETEVDKARIVFEGSQIPDYLSRWWPGRQVRYEDMPAPDLSIHFRPLSEPGAWPWLRLWRSIGVTLVGEPGCLNIRLDDQSIMTIVGQIEPAMLRDRWVVPEVYRFYSTRYLVLRLWFFWLDERPSDVQQHIHEIPDIERIDLLMDLVQRKALYACTDLHWQEVWGTVEKQPVQAHVGLSASTVLRLLGERVKDEFFDLLMMRDKTCDLKRNPAVQLCGELTGHADCGHRVGPLADEISVRGAGLFAKHVPYFDDASVRLDGKLASGDVRRS